MIFYDFVGVSGICHRYFTRSQWSSSTWPLTRGDHCAVLLRARKVISLERLERLEPQLRVQGSTFLEKSTRTTTPGVRKRSLARSGEVHRRSQLGLDNEKPAGYPASKEIAFYPSLCTGRNTKPCSARPVPIFWYPKVPSDIRPVKIPTDYRSWLDLPLFTAPTAAAPQGRVIAIAHQQEAELSG